MKNLCHLSKERIGIAGLSLRKRFMGIKEGMHNDITREFWDFK